MRFRTAIAAVAVALLAVLLGPVAPAQAAKPRLTLLFTSAPTGIVAGNAIWGQKSIQWTGYVAGRPKGSRLVTQTKVAGVWRTIATTDKSVRRTVARGRFFPVLGAHRYRIALLSKKGKLLVASKAWTSTGFATVPLSRVLTTLPPSIGTVTRTIDGYAYPMLWRIDHEDRGAADRGQLVGRGRRTVPEHQVRVERRLVRAARHDGIDVAQPDLVAEAEPSPTRAMARPAATLASGGDVHRDDHGVLGHHRRQGPRCLRRHQADGDRLDPGSAAQPGHLVQRRGAARRRRAVQPRRALSPAYAFPAATVCP